MPYPEDLQTYLMIVLEAVKSGNFRYVAALVLIAAVFFGGKLLAKKFPFFASPKGKATLNIALALLTGLGAAFAAGHVPGMQEVIAALGVSFTAAGGWSLFKAFTE